MPRALVHIQRRPELKVNTARDRWNFAGPIFVEILTEAAIILGSYHTSEVFLAGEGELFHNFNLASYTWALTFDEKSALIKVMVRGVCYVGSPRSGKG